MRDRLKSTHLPPVDPGASIRAIDALPEPARSVAIDAVKLMKDGGATTAEANETALGLASEWVGARAPGDQSELSVPDEAIPDRTEVPEDMDTKVTRRTKIARRSHST